MLLPLLLPLLTTSSTSPTSAGPPPPPIGIPGQPVADRGGLPGLPLQRAELPLHPLDVGPHPIELGALQPQAAGPVLRPPDGLPVIGPDLLQGRGHRPPPAPGLGVRRLGLEELLVRLLRAVGRGGGAAALFPLLSISILLPATRTVLVLVFIIIIIITAAITTFPTKKKQCMEGPEAIFLPRINGPDPPPLPLGMVVGRRHQPHLAAGLAELAPPLQEGQPAFLGPAAGGLPLSPGLVEVALGGVPPRGPVVALAQGPAEVPGQPAVRFAFGGGFGGLVGHGPPIGPKVGDGSLEGLQRGALLRDGSAGRLDVVVEGGVLLEEGHGPRRRGGGGHG
mmetsp:Transcript_31487/g.92343  ORF Transcript_31487/g.92343 Transcript_31487/m.92343 type:complete len:337 (-) Transcript_31487:231-1241(-)